MMTTEEWNDKPAGSNRIPTDMALVLRPVQNGGWTIEQVREGHLMPTMLGAFTTPADMLEALREAFDVRIEPKARVENPEAMEASANLIGSTAVREICGGISDMSLWRWMHDPEMKFPEPVIIQRRKYWREDEIWKWIESRSKGGMK